MHPLLIKKCKETMNEMTEVFIKKSMDIFWNVKQSVTVTKPTKTNNFIPNPQICGIITWKVFKYFLPPQCLLVKIEGWINCKVFGTYPHAKICSHIIRFLLKLTMLEKFYSMMYYEAIFIGKCLSRSRTVSHSVSHSLTH